MTKIYELQNCILIYTGYEDPAAHRHMAAHIIISTKGKMKVVSEGKECLCRGVVIPSGVTHRIDTYGNPALVFLYDSTTNVAKQIQKVQIIEEVSCDNTVVLFAEFEKSNTNFNYNKMEEYVLGRLNVEKTVCSVSDERIASAMQYIRARGTEKITCKEVADTVFLSEGRFSHLFKEQVGMTFAAYLIYQRIMNVYAGVLQGKTVTEAAVEAGFASSSHFADVNRRVFGISASNISQDLNYIKVI